MNKKAFTLIEFIIVMAVVGIIAGVAVPFAVIAIDGWVATTQLTDLSYQARFSLLRMTREIRELNATDLATNLVAFTAINIRFINMNGEEIRYQQNNNNLRRRYRTSPSAGWESWNNLCDKLQDPGGLTLVYLDEDGVVTAVKADVRMVKITLVLISNNQAITVESLARFRNL